MKILFMGTPEFAVASLEALVEAGHDICGVFTRPDQKKNRGMKLLPTAVKEYALTKNLSVYQPEQVKNQETLDLITSLNPTLIVVAAYGRILPQEILDFPKLGCINVHSSLLPKYRGAAPIHWSVVNGDQETGVTIMDMVAELDAGDIISQGRTPISLTETVEEVHDRLALLGGKLLVETVSMIEKGTATRIPQEAEKVSFAPMLSRELSPLDFSKSALTLHNQIRGLLPWPASQMELAGESIKVFASSLPDISTEMPAGKVLKGDKEGIDIACGDGKVIRLTMVQGQGGKRMSASDYLRGHPLPEA
ncbi:MAG: methionyl-tRNA formyltransferase [Eubacteriales bacterium]